MEVYESKSMLEALYQEEKYKEVVDLAFELLEVEGDSTERFQISVYLPKSFLQLVPSPNDESGVKLFNDAVSTSAGLATTIEDIWFLYKELGEAFYDWNKRCVENAMMVLVADPQVEYYRDYMQTTPNYIKISMDYELLIANSEVAKMYWRAKGLSKEEWWAEVKNNRSSEKVYLTDVEYMELHNQTALTIFSDINSKVKNYFTDDVEKAKVYTQKLCHDYIVAHSLAEFKCVNPKKEDPKDIGEKERYLSIRGYKLSAEIEKELFEAKVNFKGKPLSVFRGNRENELLSLQNTYNNIKILEPDFVIPELPSVGFVGFPKNGCYVATAVYGSYDCPQVWTLRRFRDQILAETWYGRAFICVYYALSPTIVDWFGNTRWFNKIWRKILDKKVQSLQEKGFESTPYKD